MPWALTLFRVVPQLNEALASRNMLGVNGHGADAALLGPGALGHQAAVDVDIFAGHE